MKSLRVLSKIAVIPLTAGILLAGCANEGTQQEAMTQFKSDVVARAKTNQDKMRDIYKQANGNYANLAPEQKAEFIKLNNGSEVTARQAWGYLATEGKANSFADQQVAGNK